MRRKKIIVAAVTAVALLAAGGLFASNMGFKLNYGMLAGTNAGSLNGTATLGLPFNPQTGIIDAQTLLTDIGSTNITSITQYVEATGSLVSYTNTGGGTNFPLNVGEGYYARMAADTNYIVVGSHDPSLQISLDAGDGGVTSLNGTNFVAYPYHSTANDAQALLTEIGSTNVTSITQYVASTGSLVSYTNVGGGTNFPLTPGEAYFIRSAADYLWTPAHY